MLIFQFQVSSVYRLNNNNSSNNIYHNPHIRPTTVVPDTPTPLPHDINICGQKCAHTGDIADRASALLAMLATIGCKYAPDFDGVHHQGVPLEYLGSSMQFGGAQVGHTPVLCAFFMCAASAIILHVL